MADLTGTLPEQQWAPHAIGGAPSGNIFEGLANTANSILRSVNTSTRQQSKDDDPVLDQYAMTVFQDKTGIQLGDPGYDNIVFAKRLERAKAAGNLTAAMYDIRMQGNVADLIRKNPSSAREIMADAYNLHGVKDELFREQAWASKEAENAFNNQQNSMKMLLDAGLESGQYDPRIHTQEYGQEQGLRFLKTKAEFAADKAQYEALTAQYAAHKARVEPELKQLREGILRRFNTTVDSSISAGFGKMYDLQMAAGTDQERIEMLDNELAYTKMALNMVEQNGNLFLSSYEKTVEVDGQSVTIGFDEADKTGLRNTIDRYRKMVDEVMSMDLTGKQRFLEKWATNNKVAAVKQMPAFMAFVDGPAGGSIPLALDILTNGTEKYGLDPLSLQKVLENAAAGVDKYVATSMQAIDAQTKAGANPSSNPDVSISTAAFSQNSTIAKTMGNKLKEGSFRGPGDQASAVKSFEQSYDDILLAMRGYTPNSIDATKAGKAMSVVFNDEMLLGIDAYLKNGGNQEYGNLFLQQGAIAASTFYEGLLSRHQLKFDERSQRVVAWGGGQGMTNIGNGVPYGGGEFSYTPPQGINNQDKEAALLANQLLGYMEKVHQRLPVVDEALLKGTGLNLRQLIGSQGGLQKGLEFAASQVKQSLAEQSRSAFQDAIDGLTVEGTDMVGGIDVNPFDDLTENSPSFSSPSGQYNLSAKAPEEWEGPINSVSQEFNLDPALLTALIKQESSFNPKAVGPVIPRLKGTPDERAIGIGQLLPSTAKEMGVDVNNPQDNLRGAAKYLSLQMQKFNDDPVLALMAYNWGPASVERWLKSGADPSKAPKETIDYVKRILGVDITDMKG